MRYPDGVLKRGFEESKDVGVLVDAFGRGLAGAVAGAGFDADQDGRGGRPGPACRAAAYLKLWAGTTRSSWSAVMIRVAGYFAAGRMLWSGEYL